MKPGRLARHLAAEEGADLTTDAERASYLREHERAVRYISGIKTATYDNDEVRIPIRPFDKSEDGSNSFQVASNGRIPGLQSNSRYTSLERWLPPRADSSERSSSGLHVGTVAINSRKYSEPASNADLMSLRSDPQDSFSQQRSLSGLKAIFDVIHCVLIIVLVLCAAQGWFTFYSWAEYDTEPHVAANYHEYYESRGALDRGLGILAGAFALYLAFGVSAASFCAGGLADWLLVCLLPYWLRVGYRRTSVATPSTDCRLTKKSQNIPGYELLMPGAREVYSGSAAEVPVSAGGGSARARKPVAASRLPESGSRPAKVILPSVIEYNNHVTRTTRQVQSNVDLRLAETRARSSSLAAVPVLNLLRTKSSRRGVGTSGSSSGGKTSSDRTGSGPKPDGGTSSRSGATQSGSGGRSGTPRSRSDSCDPAQLQRKSQLFEALHVRNSFTVSRLRQPGSPERLAGAEALPGRGEGEVGLSGGNPAAASVATDVQLDELDELGRPWRTDPGADNLPRTAHRLHVTEHGSGIAFAYHLGGALWRGSPARSSRGSWRADRVASGTSYTMTRSHAVGTGAREAEMSVLHSGYHQASSVPSVGGSGTHLTAGSATGRADSVGMSAAGYAPGGSPKPTVRSPMAESHETSSALPGPRSVMQESLSPGIVSGSEPVRRGDATRSHLQSLDRRYHAVVTAGARSPWGGSAAGSPQSRRELMQPSVADSGRNGVESTDATDGRGKPSFPAAATMTAGDAGDAAQAVGVRTKPPPREAEYAVEAEGMLLPTTSGSQSKGTSSGAELARKGYEAHEPPSGDSIVSNQPLNRSSGLDAIDEGDQWPLYQDTPLQRAQSRSTHDILSLKYLGQVQAGVGSSSASRDGSDTSNASRASSGAVSEASRSDARSSTSHPGGIGLYRPAKGSSLARITSWTAGPDMQLGGSGENTSNAGEVEMEHSRELGRQRRAHSKSWTSPRDGEGQEIAGTKVPRRSAGYEAQPNRHLDSAKALPRPLRRVPVLPLLPGSADQLSRTPSASGCPKQGIQSEQRTADRALKPGYGGTGLVLGSMRASLDDSEAYRLSTSQSGTTPPSSNRMDAFEGEGVSNVRMVSVETSSVPPLSSRGWGQPTSGVLEADSIIRQRSRSKSASGSEGYDPDSARAGVASAAIGATSAWLSRTGRRGRQGKVGRVGRARPRIASHGAVPHLHHDDPQSSMEGALVEVSVETTYHTSRVSGSQSRSHSAMGRGSKGSHLPDVCRLGEGSSETTPSTTWDDDRNLSRRRQGVDFATSFDKTDESQRRRMELDLIGGSTLGSITGGLAMLRIGEQVREHHTRDQGRPTEGQTLVISQLEAGQVVPPDAEDTQKTARAEDQPSVADAESARERQHRQARARQARVRPSLTDDPDFMDSGADAISPNPSGSVALSGSTIGLLRSSSRASRPSAASKRTDVHADGVRVARASGTGIIEGGGLIVAVGRQSTSSAAVPKGSSVSRGEGSSSAKASSFPATGSHPSEVTKGNWAASDSSGIAVTAGEVASQSAPGQLPPFQAQRSKRRAEKQQDAAEATWGFPSDRHGPKLAAHHRIAGVSGDASPVGSFGVLRSAHSLSPDALGGSLRPTRSRAGAGKLAIRGRKGVQNRSPEPGSPGAGSPGGTSRSSSAHRMIGSRGRGEGSRRRRRRESSKRTIEMLVASGGSRPSSNQRSNVDSRGVAPADHPQPSAAPLSMDPMVTVQGTQPRGAAAGPDPIEENSEANGSSRDPLSSRESGEAVMDQQRVLGLRSSGGERGLGSGREKGRGLADSPRLGGVEGHRSSIASPPVPADRSLGRHFKRYGASNDVKEKGVDRGTGACSHCCPSCDSLAEEALSRAVSSQAFSQAKCCCCWEKGSSGEGEVGTVAGGASHGSAPTTRCGCCPYQRRRVHPQSVVVRFWLMAPLVLCTWVAMAYYGYFLYGSYAPFYFRFEDASHDAYGEFGGPLQGLGYGEQLGEDPRVTNAACLTAKGLVVDLRFAELQPWVWPRGFWDRRWLSAVMLDRIDVPSQRACSPGTGWGEEAATTAIGKYELVGGVYLAPVLAGNTSFETWPSPESEACSARNASSGGGGSAGCLAGVGGDMPWNVSVKSPDRPIRGFLAVLVPPDSQLACPGEGSPVARRGLLAEAIARQAGVTIRLDQQEGTLAVGEGAPVASGGRRVMSLRGDGELLRGAMAPRVGRGLAGAGVGVDGGDGELLGQEGLVYRGPVMGLGWAAVRRTAEHVQRGVLGAGTGTGTGGLESSVDAAMARLLARVEGAASGGVLDRIGLGGAGGVGPGDPADTAGVAQGSPLSGRRLDVFQVGSVDLLSARTVAHHAKDSVAMLPLGGRWSTDSSGFWVWLGVGLWLCPVGLLVFSRGASRCLECAGFPGLSVQW